MKSLEFNEVYDLHGGIVAWEEAGLPLVTPDTSGSTSDPATTLPAATSPPSSSDSKTPAKFAVSNLHTDPPVPVPPSGLFSFIVTVTNEGGVEGYYEAVVEVVEVIGVIRLEIGSVSERVLIPPGQSRIVTFEQIHLTQGIFEATIEKENLLFECT
ncbi:MAG: hypothetical protein JW954_08675 [Dehalococcoidaceae bacterium]|nr:hypothetical protein [Dehalococcoidaceae bacterium]